jgi:hypothetical protein
MPIFLSNIMRNSRGNRHEQVTVQVVKTGITP